MYCTKCGTQLDDSALFCSHCGSQTSPNSPGHISPAPAQYIAEPTEQILEYLQQAKKLEIHKHTLESTFQQLQRKANTLGRPKTFEKPESTISEAKNPFWPIFWIVLGIGLIISIFTCGDAEDSVVANIISILTIVMLFFNGELLIGVALSVVAAAGVALLVVLCSALIRTIIYLRHMKAYRNVVKADKMRVAEEQRYAKSLVAQMNELNAEWGRLSNIRTNFYSKNVIAPKYQNLTAIVTMCEYFELERCYGLKGPHGAYNLYEYEIRMNLIITKLDQVISMLAQIKENQRALYDAIQESNRISEQICRESEEMRRSLKNIERNSAITAYSAKLTAEYQSINTYIAVSKF